MVIGGVGIREKVVKPTSNQQPLPYDPTPQRYRRIVRRAKAQGPEARDRVEEGGRETKKLKKSQKRYKRGVENGGDSERRRKNVDKKALVL